MTATDDNQTRRVDVLINHYAQSHQNPVNEALHFLAVPLIMLSLCGLIHAVHEFLLFAFLAASLVYYMRLSWVFFGTMLVWTVLLLAGVLAMGTNAVPISVAMFVGAWIVQFVGHKIERKKPSFFEDIQYLWVGPLFLLSKVFTKLGIKW